MRGEKKESYPKLEGAWNSHFQATAKDSSEQLLWKKSPPHAHPSRHIRVPHISYHFAHVTATQAPTIIAEEKQSKLMPCKAP